MTILLLILYMGPDVPKDPSEATLALSEAGYLDVRCESGAVVVSTVIASISLLGNVGLFAWILIRKKKCF